MTDKIPAMPNLAYEDVHGVLVVPPQFIVTRLEEGLQLSQNKEATDIQWKMNVGECMLFIPVMAQGAVVVSEDEWLAIEAGITAVRLVAQLRDRHPELFTLGEPPALEAVADTLVKHSQRCLKLPHGGFRAVPRVDIPNQGGSRGPQRYH